MVGSRERVNAYYNVAFGKIVKLFGKEKPENEQAESRININGDTVYEKKFEYISGKITRSELVTPPKGKESFGDVIKLTLTNGNDSAVCQIRFNGSYGRGLCNTIPNIDIDEPIEIEPYDYISRKKKGKRVVGLKIFQKGIQVNWAYSRDKPNGLPPLEEVMFKGEKAWDNTNQLAFYKKNFEEFCEKINNSQNINIENIEVNDPIEVENNPHVDIDENSIDF